MQKLNPTKIEALLTKLTKGKSVSMRDLENVLGLIGLVARRLFKLKLTAQQHAIFYVHSHTSISQLKQLKTCLTQAAGCD